MRSRRVAALSLSLSMLLFAAACADGGDTPEPADETPAEKLFGTADLESMVLAETEGPSGLEFDDEVSGPLTVYASFPDEARMSAATDAGFQLGFTNEWIAPPTADGSPAKPVGELKATRLVSDAAIYESSESASEALAFLKENGNPEATDRTFEDVQELGEEAYSATTTFEDPGQPPLFSYSYQWRVKNALGLLIVQSPKELDAAGGPTTEQLLGEAQEIATAMEETEPTGEALAGLPGEATAGEVLFEDDFSDENVGWKIGSFPGEPPGNETSYANGQMVSTIGESGGGRFNDTGEIGKQYADFTDTFVSVDAESAGGQEEAGWGVICREQKGETFYAFIIQGSGRIHIVEGVAPAEPFAFFLTLTPTESVAQSLAEPHTLRAECVGDQIARLALYLNDEKIAEAYDDEPLTSGAAGMWTEAPPEVGAEILFDNFSVTEATLAE